MPIYWRHAAAPKRSNNFGPKARLIPAWGTAPGLVSYETMSANGAVYTCGIVSERLMNGTWRDDGPGFQPLAGLAV